MNATIEWEYGVTTNSTSTDTAKRDLQALDSPVEEHMVVKRATEHYSSYGTKTSYAGWRSAVQHPQTFDNHATYTRSYYSHPSNTAQPSAVKLAVEPSGIAYHQLYRQSQLDFSEVDMQTEFGNWYYVAANTSTLSHQSGQDVVVRDQFINNGVLANTEDTNYRASSDDLPVFGFAYDLGSVGSDSVSSLFGISLNQDFPIQFEGASGNVTLPSLWTSYFDSDLDAISFFYDDYSTASSLCITFDDQIASDSDAAAGGNYTLITSLAARQAFGANQLVGTPNTTYYFLKEISSDGNIQTVDVIFPFHPILLYTNPTLLKYMLEPLFINQEAGYWPYMYSIHDLGDSYPNATGHNDGVDEMQPLEECGNMLIMSLAYAQRANDNAWLASHYSILRQWTQYLIEEALIPMNQISTDDFAGALA